ncbi:uncharacterized protein L969DRAFT_72770 [Mixia osmundae IAM 14324]|uniref:Glycosyl transferase CAP10 domain-containing protein n=1 Tax=Mixia osmundae (strain CBS 9802 / IAM 14324 / JCM 22182 / KY 12970) TaxID=764103 RepID=G7DUC6_MIXOS|nr:uncharacterized protein L969DRAFT_72770 [Mixia osmundae IAM 14324]KEI41058.1 hypothetical protein L969DRAFT_72770 [Mixia osmundae IAM 14324]GAA94186.1 hypothetical protein E5Q_00834 [Mixia osmundae IAM 14324]
MQDDLSMSRQACQLQFPLLYSEIQLAREHFAREPITDAAVQASYAAISGGKARVHVQGHSFAISGFHAGWRQRMYSLLASLHEAVSNAPDDEPLPAIAMTLHANDNGAAGVAWPVVLPVQDRGKAFLAPDFGFHSWHGDVDHGLWTSFRSSAKQIDDGLTWRAKIPKLFWRGDDFTPARKQLVEQARGREWSDVESLLWAEPSRNKAISMPDHCRYAFLAQTEGASYSGRLKYILNCRSVVISHPLHYQQHFHSLLNATQGPEQNIVILPHSFDDLSVTMQTLLADSSRAEAIANQSALVFRDQYLTPAATACYWREALRVYATVQAATPRRSWLSVDYATFVRITSYWHLGLVCIALLLLSAILLAYKYRLELLPRMRFSNRKRAYDAVKTTAD